MAGRPKVRFDMAELGKLANMQCTLDEIAAWFKVSLATVNRRMVKDRKFRDIVVQGRETGKASLRRVQLKAALDGDRTMLVWLGKQYLGQKDRQEVTGKDGSPLRTETHISVVSERAKSLTADILAGVRTDMIPLPANVAENTKN